MLTHRGFSAWIISEGKELSEYDVVVDHNTNKVTCWTPCEIGKTFSVHWMDHGTNVDSAAYIHLDGFAAPGRFLHGIGAAERSGVRVGECSERPFQFASPDPAEACSSESTPAIGTIVLRIKQVTRIADHAANAPIKPPSPPRTRHGVTEARVGYGPERTAYLQHEKTWSFVPYDKSQPGSYVQFVFRYRTREFLIEQGIIPRPSQTEPNSMPLLFVNEQFPTAQNEESGNYPVVDSCPSWLPPQQHWNTPPVSPTDAINPAFLTLFPPQT